MKRTKARFPIGADGESGVEPLAKELASAGYGLHVEGK